MSQLVFKNKKSLMRFLKRNPECSRKILVVQEKISDESLISHYYINGQLRFSQYIHLNIVEEEILYRHGIQPIAFFRGDGYFQCFESKNKNISVLITQSDVSDCHGENFRFMHGAYIKEFRCSHGKIRGLAVLYSAGQEARISFRLDNKDRPWFAYVVEPL